MEYLFHVLIVLGIYNVLSVSLSLVAGQIGILSIAQAGFYGIGAYTSGAMASTSPVSGCSSLLSSLC